MAQKEIGHSAGHPGERAVELPQSVQMILSREGVTLERLKEASPAEIHEFARRQAVREIAQAGDAARKAGLEGSARRTQATLEVKGFAGMKTEEQSRAMDKASLMAAKIKREQVVPDLISRIEREILSVTQEQGTFEVKDEDIDAVLGSLGDPN